MFMTRINGLSVVFQELNYFISVLCVYPHSLCYILLG